MISILKARQGIDLLLTGLIRYKDIEPWYSYVENLSGIAGNKDGLAELPDSVK